MVAAADTFIALSLLAGGVLVGLGVVSYRRDEPGAAAFGAFAAGWGVLPFVDTGVVLVFGSGTIAGFFWVLVTVPWMLFALQYTGRRISRRTVALLTLPAAGLVPWVVAAITGGPTAAFQVVGILIFVYYAALAVVGGILVLRATRRYAHLSVTQGGWLAAAGVLPPATMNAFGVLLEQVGEGVLFGIYAGGVVGVCVCVGLALFADDVFDSTAAPGAVGERAIAQETDDLIAIVDDEGRLLEGNATARERLPRMGAATGDPVETVLGADIDELQHRETVDIRTEHGRRTVDSRVTALTDQHDRELGWMVSLRDVTARERRRQRLEVLNRVVGHNLRNRASVIDANTEAVAAELDDETLRARLDTASEAVDSLVSLGEKARTAEKLLGDDDRARSAVDLRAILDDATTEYSEQCPAASISANGTAATVETDPDVLRLALDNLVENAVEHGGEQPQIELSAAIDGEWVTITVDDDGPGIPDREIEVIESGTETPLRHGSGIGLWVTNWAAQELGGDLTFEECETGSAVQIRLPAGG